MALNTINAGDPVTAAYLSLALKGTVAVSEGGTGAVTLTGVLVGNGASAMTGVITTAGLATALSSDGRTGTGAFVCATSPTLVTPILGTPTSGNLSNCTALPVGSVTGLGTGVATFLATPSSANLLAAITDETGTGLAVFATSPTFTTSLLTGSTTFAVFNATATTINAFGAATVVNIGASTGYTKVAHALNIGTTTASGVGNKYQSGALDKVNTGRHTLYSWHGDITAGGTKNIDITPVNATVWGFCAVITAMGYYGTSTPASEAHQWSVSANYESSSERDPVSTSRWVQGVRNNLTIAAPVWTSGATLRIVITNGNASDFHGAITFDITAWTDGGGADPIGTINGVS